MMAAEHGTYAANVIGSTGDRGNWISEYKKRLTVVKKPWDGSCSFHNCHEKDVSVGGHHKLVGGHVWIRGDTSNHWYYIVPICQGCNNVKTMARAYDNWTLLKTGTKVLRINVKKSVAKLWLDQQSRVRRRFDDEQPSNLPVQTDIDTEGIVNDQVMAELDSTITCLFGSLADVERMYG